MNDSELSLAVAIIIWPEHVFYLGTLEDSDTAFGHNEKDEQIIGFDSTTDDALGKMAVWYTKHLFKQKYESFEEMTCVFSRVANFLRHNDRHRALAEAIVEIGEKP